MDKNEGVAEGEIWRPVGWLGFFEASSWGRIRAVPSCKIKPQTLAKSGFLVVNLYAVGRQNVRNVQSVIAEAFLGPRPAGFMVLHRNGMRIDNRSANLRYCHLGKRVPKCQNGAGATLGPKLTRLDAEQIRSRARTGAATIALAQEFSVSAPLVSSIKHGRKWKSGRETSQHVEGSLSGQLFKA